tara:strand:+ start:169 stop:426 length:258 start_codon:yes stop_codon:yes gene_type:complete
MEFYKIKKLTPLHTKDWYIKWCSSVCIIFALLLTSNEVYPLNLIFHGIGLLGWLIVGMIWMDRSLIVLNAIGITIIINSLIGYLL